MVVLEVGEILKMSVETLCEQFQRLQMRVGLTCIAKRCNFISCIDCVKVFGKTLWFKVAVQ